jgi:hypothetical protein
MRAGDALPRVSFLVTAVAGTLTGTWLALAIRLWLLDPPLSTVGLAALVGFLCVPVLGALVLAPRIFRRHSSLGRAERAFHAGRLGEALERFARAGRDERVLTCLQVRLPTWVPKVELIAAVRELLALRSCVRRARAAGLSPTLTAGVAADTERALDQVWRRADRIALAAALGLEPRRVVDDLAADARDLLRLAEAAAETRRQLALATMRGVEEVESLLIGLRLTGEQARDLARR